MVDAAKKAGIPIVRIAWLNDSIKQKVVLDTNDYILEKINHENKRKRNEGGDALVGSPKKKNKINIPDEHQEEMEAVLAELREIKAEAKSYLEYDVDCRRRLPNGRIVIDSNIYKIDMRKY